MNISAVSPIYDVPSSASTPITNTTDGDSAKGSAISTGQGTAFPFVTADDVSIVERINGTSALDVSEIPMLQWINGARERGDVTGSLAKYVPEANLTASDAALLEKTTGTTSIEGALASGGSDAASLMLNISGDRQDGSLKGDITTSYLQNLLGVSEQLEKAGQDGNFASSAFLKNAISDVEEAVQSSGSVLNTTA